VIHLLHLLQALVAGGVIAGVGVLVRGGPATRMRIGVGGRIRTLALPRSRSFGARRFIDRLRVALLGEDGRAPVGAGLAGTRVATQGLPALRWPLLHAGLGHRSLLWFRVKQCEGGVTAAALGAGFAVTLAHRPVALLGPVVLVTFTLGCLLSERALARLAAARRRRLCVQLVSLLYGLGASIAGGRPVAVALDRVAVRQGELFREVYRARQLEAYGVKRSEALAALVVRCDTPEVQTAVSLILTVDEGKLAGERAPALLRELATMTRTAIRERRKVELAYALLRSTAIGTVSALPVLGTVILYPVLSRLLTVVPH